jgi:Response regulator containing CheY-like receiver, AAA-type ATPase, and DNA-binding domains
LKAAIARGTFRQDLFYRLNVFPIEVPPLRERKEDIGMLVEYFLQRCASLAGKNIRSIDKNTLELFQSYDWPGNIWLNDLQSSLSQHMKMASLFGMITRASESS